MCDINNPPKDTKKLELWMLNVIYALDMKPLINPQAVYCNTNGNEGMTCICAIETSHMVMHTWDNDLPAKMQLDIYTCGELNLETVFSKLNQFRPIKVQYKFYDRESEFTLLSERPDPLQVLSDKGGEVKANLVSHKWKFAKTMPQIPHWYTLVKDWKDKNKFVDSVIYINEYGIKEEWNGKYYTYLYHEDYKYWTMEPPDVPPHKHILINRAKA